MPFSEGVAMGVMALLAYLAGAGVLTLGARHVLLDLLSGEAWDSSLQVLLVGTLLVAAAAVLHALVIRRRGHGGLLSSEAHWLQASAGIGGLLWLLPLLAAWLQFEFFVEPVRLFPLPAVLGAMLMVYAIGARLMRQWTWVQPLSMVGVALLGMPLGLLSVALPAAHFQHHLSSVSMQMALPGVGQAQTYAPPASDLSPAPSLRGTGPGTLEFLEALAQARPIDVQAELAAGRLRRLPDGSLVVVADDGSESPVGTGQDLEMALDAAVRADGEAADKAALAEEAAWQAALRERREGGRWLGRQPG